MSTKNSSTHDMRRKKQLEYQRRKRKETGDIYTKRYEKTVNGFLMRAYRNMKSRVTGVQHKKHHLYKNVNLWSKDDFMIWTFSSPVFLSLFTEWEKSGYDRKLTPSVDRVNSNVATRLIIASG